MHDGRRTQVPRRTEHLARERLVVRRVLPHVERDELLPLGDVNDMRRLRQRKRFGPPLPFFARVGYRFDFHGVLLKEPLSFLARRSVLAMVHPIDLAWH